MNPLGPGLGELERGWGQFHCGLGCFWAWRTESPVEQVLFVPFLGGEGAGGEAASFKSLIPHLNLFNHLSPLRA